MGRWQARWVPSIRVLVLAAAALVTVTLAAAVRVVSLSPAGRIAVEPEPVVAWIAVAGVVAIFTAILAGVVMYRRR